MVTKSTNQLKLCSQGRSAAANNMRECISIHIGQVGEYPDNDDDDDDNGDDDDDDPMPRAKIIIHYHYVMTI